MALNPVPVAMVLTVYYVFTAVMFGDALIEAAIPDAFQSDKIPTEDEETGIFNFVGQVTNVVLGLVQLAWNVVTIIVQIATFGIPTEPPPPAWIRFLVGTPITVSTIWSIATLVRGN